MPSHVSLQQTESTQWRDAHAVSPPHAVPFLERHAPSPSQVFSAEQAESASSVNLGTSVQVPADPGSAQDWQVPHAALPQQTPSTQLAEAHSLEKAQALPSILRHVLVSSQIESPPQVSSVVFLIGEQVPTFPVRAQLSQAPSHARSQHTPSTQRPFGH